MSPHHGHSPSDEGEPQPHQRGYEQRSTQSGQPGGHQGSGQPGGYQQSGQPGQYQQSGGFEQTRQQSQFGSQWGHQQPEQPQQGGQRQPGQGAQQPTSGGQGGSPQQGRGGYAQRGQRPYQGGQGSFQQSGSQHGATHGSQQRQSSFQHPGGAGSQYAGAQPAGQGATGQQGYGAHQVMGAQQPMVTHRMGGQPMGVQGMGTQQIGDRGTTRRRPGPQLRPVTVEEIVQGDPVTAERDSPVTEIVAKMAEEDVGSVIVVEGERPVGIVTDRKIAMAIEQYETVAELVADDLVSGDVVTTTPEDSVFEVLRTFRDEGIRRLPVVDEDGTLQGIVTLDDLIVLLATEIGNVGETIQAQIDRL